MDKETAERLTKLEAKDEAKEKRLEFIEKERESWNSLIRSVMVKTVVWLVAVGGSGIIFGWQLPPDIRKAIMEWAAK